MTVPANPPILVAFRTHLWDVPIAQLANRLRASVPGFHFIVLADETRHAINPAPFEKLSHTQDFSEFGLPDFPPGKTLWHNADYAIYKLRRAFPKASHFCLVEYDVTINIDLTALLRHAVGANIDLLCDGIIPATPDWRWYGAIAYHFANPLGAFIPLMIVSARAADHLLNRRRELFDLEKTEGFQNWPFCEAFIPTVIRELPGCRFDQLKNHADLSDFGVKDPFHIADPRAYRASTICHPVLGGYAFFDRCIAYDQPAALFEPTSKLRQILSTFPPAEFMPCLANLARQKNTPEFSEAILTLATEQGWI